MEILPQMYLCTMKNLLNCGTHLDPGIFLGILQHCEICPEKVIGLKKLLSQMYSCTRKSLLNFQSDLDPESGSRLYSPWRDVCGL